MFILPGGGKKEYEDLRRKTFGRGQIEGSRGKTNSSFTSEGNEEEKLSFPQGRGEEGGRQFIHIVQRESPTSRGRELAARKGGDPCLRHRFIRKKR